MNNASDSKLNQQQTMKPALVTAGLIFCLAIFAIITPASAANYAFEFNDDGVLPSAQGAGYFAIPSGVSESSVFSVSGGVLRQDTASISSSVRADYDVEPGSYDPNFQAILEWRVKVIDSFRGVTVRLGDGRGHDWFVSLSTNGISVSNTAPIVIPMDTTDAFHVYRLVVPAQSANFILYVDGEMRFSGSAVTSSGAPYSYFGWGDMSTLSQAKARAEWDYVRLLNGPELSIRVSQVRLCWPSALNQTYQLQYRSTLTKNQWTQLGDPIAGNGGTNCVTEPIEGTEQRFYRVQESP